MVTANDDVIIQPFIDAIKTIENDGVVQTGSETVESGSLTLNVTCIGFICTYPGFEITTGDVVSFGGDINLETNLIFLSSGNTRRFTTKFMNNIIDRLSSIRRPLRLDATPWL